MATDTAQAWQRRVIQGCKGGSVGPGLVIRKGEQLLSEQPWVSAPPPLGSPTSKHTHLSTPTTLPRELSRGQVGPGSVSLRGSWSILVCHFLTAPTFPPVLLHQPQSIPSPPWKVTAAPAPGVRLRVRNPSPCQPKERSARSVRWQNRDWAPRIYSHIFFLSERIQC